MVRRHRRSADEVEQAIRDAVLAEMADGGYAAVTFEGIARRAGTSKPVLYRRFPDRASMIFDAMRSRRTARPLTASSGSLRTDLMALLGTVRHKTSRFDADAYRALIGEAHDQTLAQAAAMTIEVASRVDEVVVAPARERGELGPLPLDPEVVLAPLRLSRDRLLFGPVGADDVADIVDKVALPLYRAASGLTGP